MLHKEYSPRQAKKMGTVITTAIGYYVGGYFKEMGAEAARNQIQSGQTYTTYYYVQMSDGYYYKVCQNYRNNRAISEPYWCQ